MPKIKLTVKAIDRMAAPTATGKPILFWDTELKGFAVLCSGVTNSKTYVVQRDVNGRTSRNTVAAVAEVDLDKARDLAADMLLDLRRGINPKKKAEVITLQSALDTYLTARKNLRPASVNVYRQIERVLKSWMPYNLSDITPDMVEKRHRAVAVDHGEVTANGVMRTVSILWNYAVERGAVLPSNPVRILKRQWFPEERRTGMVRAEQMPKFYQAILALPSTIARDYLIFVLFTGLRRREAALLTWHDIDLPNRVLRSPAANAKGTRKLDLPLSDQVYDMLVARRALGDAGYVFPGSGKSGHISDLQSPLKTIAEATGIKVTPHDLRRTFITVAEGTDISAFALKAMVSHSLGKDVTAGYIQLSVERLRQPVQLVANRIAALCGIKPVAGGNVAKMRARGRG